MLRLGGIRLNPDIAKSPEFASPYLVHEIVHLIMSAVRTLQSRPRGQLDRRTDLHALRG